uniref:DUF7788 domain-containing protein n=1 Tax=viral metagenome TaxID=1070528 RepID=A0A6C0D9X2_9ZZZZ
MEFFTKTANGNKSVDTDKRSIFNGIWSLMKGSPENRIIELYRQALSEALSLEDLNERTQRVVHILTLALRMRDIRNGGHGRRSEFFTALLTILPIINDENVTKMILSLVATHHGRWKDLTDICDNLDKPSTFSSEFIVSTKTIIRNLFIDQIKAEVEGRHALTMCSKWFPTQNGNLVRAVEYGRALFPHITQDLTFQGKPVTEASPLNHKWHRVLKSSRIYLGTLRSKIPMLERFLCQDMADEIDPQKIPGVARQRNQRALENKASLRSKKGDVQRSENPKRIQCALNVAAHALSAQEAFQAHRKKMDELMNKMSPCETDEQRQQLALQIQEADEKYESTAPKVHGGDTVTIEALVSQYSRESGPNVMIETQFQAMQSKLKALATLRVLYVLDTSGSMNGIPINVGTGLVALCASNAGPAFRHKCVSFSGSPQVWDLSNMNGGNPRLYDYIQHFNRNSIISNTNVKATIDLIAEMCRNVSDVESLDMIVFLSDCQFDQIANTTTGITAGDYCKQKFASINRKMPLVCFWNLNGANSDSPAEPSDHGIVMMSGYSHTMLESFAETVIAASQASLEEVKAQREAAKKAFEEKRLIAIAKANEERELNTYQVMLDFCEGKFSYPLRMKLAELETGLFAEYTFTLPEEV